MELEVKNKGCYGCGSQEIFGIIYDRWTCFHCLMDYHDTMIQIAEWREKHEQNCFDPRLAESNG
jgi:hypothetical protein